MLRSLQVRDYVIVDHADIEFQSGFTVFSGETGAGKSILVDALALTLGGRADTTVVREGAERADLTAEFQVSPAIAQWLEDHLLPTDTLLLRRVIDARGRSRAFINGVPATLTQLRELGEQLVDIHGQHAHQSLLRPDAQRDLLDTHGQNMPLRRTLAEAWRAWRQCLAALERAQNQAEEIALERDRLQWQFDEIDRLELAPDEWAQLQAEHDRLSHAQALIEGVAATVAQLDEDDDNTHHRLVAAVQTLRQLSRHDESLASPLEAIESARIALDEATSDLRSYLARLEPDPNRLTHLDTRMRAIFDVARKYRLEPDELAARHAALHEELQQLAASEDIAALQQAADEAEARWQAAAKELRGARAKAAAALSRAVTEAMQTLAMAGGRFEVALLDTEPGPHGDQTVEFRVAGHTGTTPRPLAKVASGGELSRISLALSVIASQAARVPTLIFDEVDSGVSGAVAEVVGRLLRELGERHQVLCVTHLPQVAACGAHHFQVSKTQHKKRTLSRIEALDQEGRVAELARLLGGIEITTTTRRHAREMLIGER